jgi:hypothetical protein
MTSIEKCLEHWTNIEQSRKQEIQNIIKELDEICIKQPFNYSMFEIRMNDVRRLRLDVEHINWFITSMENYKKLDNTWIESNSEIPNICSSKTEISDEEIEKATNNPNNDGYSFREGAKWYREQLKQL